MFIYFFVGFKAYILGHCTAILFIYLFIIIFLVYAINGSKLLLLANYLTSVVKKKQKIGLKKHTP